ncbi:hypothetical protein WA158_004272 [Blastocystis sp. Blastoise]
MSENSNSEIILEEITKKVKHVAIIMDGNRRWAKKNGKQTIEGHKEGVEALKKTLTFAYDHNIPFLTIYAFSTENWKRTPQEVDDLMQLFGSFVDSLLSSFHPETTEKKVQLVFKMDQLEELTKEETHLTVNVCLDYSGKWDISQACMNIIQRYREDDRELSYDSIEQQINECLSTKGDPDVDLLIRTGGEYRVSNFLLWQIAYAEIVIVDELWPEFDEDIFKRCLMELSHRERRFGK